jgi:hypothetical protein
MQLKLKIFFAIYIFGIQFAIGQKIRCIDSITNNFYHSDKLMPFTPFSIFTIDNNENILIQTIATNINGSLELLKLNKKHQLVFGKTKFLPTRQLAISHTDRNNNVLFCGPMGSSYGNGVIVKTDSNANVLWQNNYYSLDIGEPHEILETKSGENDDIIVNMNSAGNNGNHLKLALLDKNGNIKWAKKYSKTATGTFYFINNPFITLAGKNIIILSQFFQLTSAGIGVGFMITKADYNTGALIESKSFRFEQYISPAFSYRHDFKCFNYDSISKKYMIGIVPDPRAYLGNIAIVLNDKLEVEKAKQYNFSNLSQNSEPTIGKNNILSAFWPVYSDTSILYASFNNNLDLIAQKVISLKDYSLGNQTYNGVGIQDKSGLVTFLISSFQNKSIALIKNSPFFIDSNNKCLGIDTSFL